MNASRKGRALALALLALLVGAPRAHAQGAFYAEEERDGRIHVFNNGKQYEAWKKGGELGVSITRIGAGPDGETMVFDSEEAIHLYNFKHDRPPEVIEKKEAPKPLQKFGWKDGKTTFETDGAKLVISNRVQVRYTVVDPDGDADTVGSFRIRRAKTKFEGHIHRPEWTYELQLNWPDTANPLEDVNLNFDLTGTRALMVKAGQFKVPFGRQELTSSGSQQFVDRSIVAGEFFRGRDQGVQLWGTPLDGRLDWRLGVFNGNGRTRSANDNDEYQWNGRLAWQPWGDVKYSEGDFESTDRPLFALAGNFEVNDPRPVADSAGMPIGVKRELFGGDAVFKFKGLSALLEYVTRKNTPEAEGADEFDSEGWHAQVGYLVVPARFEVAGRYATLDPTDAKDDDDRHELGLGAGWFWNKHNMKLQGDWRRLENDAKDTKDHELRVQLQFIF